MADVQGEAASGGKPPPAASSAGQEEPQPAVLPEAPEEKEAPGGDARKQAPQEWAAPAADDKKRVPGEWASVDTRSRQGSVSVDTTTDQFKVKRFFVLRPGTLNQGIKDIEALVDKELDGSVQSIWLMAEVDHWNNEKERVVLITDYSLLVFKYDFVMFNCEQFHRIPLNFVDRISYGTFTFPKHSLLRREGQGLRVFWDRMREPSFSSRWNPFSTDLPFMTFTYHPVADVSDTLAALCDINKFREQLHAAAQKVHSIKPVPGKANGVLMLNQDILIEAYVGVMAFFGNQNKLGYCMARGNIGF